MSRGMLIGIILIVLGQLMVLGSNVYRWGYEHAKEEGVKVEQELNSYKAKFGELTKEGNYE